MARILFKSIIYSSCERALKNGRVQSKIGNRLLVTWFFWLHMIIYDYFSSVLCIVPKKVLVLKYRKRVCNGPVGCIMKMWGYQHWNTANTKLDIYLLFENGHKSIQTKRKFCSNLTKCTITIDFRITSVFFVNLKHLSHPTLVLLFIIWKGKCWLKVRRELFVKIIQWS